MAAPTLFAAGALFAANSGTSITPVIPASTAANDVMLMAVMCNGSSTFTTPAEWTLLGTSIESNANQSTEWYWKRHDGTESNPTSTTSATLSNTLGGYGRIYVFRGCVTTGDPFEDVTMAGTPTSSTTPTSAAIDTTAADRLAVVLLMVDDANTWSSGNPPAGWTAIGLVSSTVGGNGMMDGLTKTVASASNVAQVTIGTMGAADYWRSVTLALIPGTASVTGVGAAAFGGTFTASGQPRTFGAAATSFGGTFTANGIDRALGTALASLGFTGTASGAAGAPPVLGAGAAAFGFTGAATGQPRTFGVAAVALGFTGTASGQPRTFGAAVASFGGSFTASGVPRPLGVAVASFDFAGAALGIDRALGVATALLGFTGTGSGSATGGTEVFGAGVGAFGFAGAANGQPRRFGSAVALFGFTGTASGSAPVPPVAERTITVQATSRTTTARGTSRTRALSAVDRETTPGAETRTTGV